MLNSYRPTTYTGHVILEMVTTERTYVGDLTDIVEVHVRVRMYRFFLQVYIWMWNEIDGCQLVLKQQVMSPLHTPGLHCSTGEQSWLLGAN